MGMKTDHGMKAFSRTSITCMRGYIDMLEAHFHIKCQKMDGCLQVTRTFLQRYGGKRLMKAQNLRRSYFLVVPASARVANRRSLAKDFPPRIYVDAGIILPKMSHALKPSLTPSAPPPRPASCSTGLAGRHSFAEHP